MQSSKLDRAVFLDKDGTLITDVPYNADPGKICFYDDAFQSLRLLQANGYRIVIVSNQSGIARGYFTEEEFKNIESAIVQQVKAAGVTIDGFYYCPHHPDGTVKQYAKTCLCRKPLPGLLQRAAVDIGIDLRHSWMIGNAGCDIEAGCNAGCRTILIHNNDAQNLHALQHEPTYQKAGLTDAVNTIIVQDVGTYKLG